MQLSGSVTALATPFRADGSIDFDALHSLADWQVRAGTAAVVVAGSTGEAAALDDDEYAEVVAAVVAAVARRRPVGAGTGLSSTSATLARTRSAAACGVDFALVVTPPYVRPSQAGLQRHYEQLAEHGNLPLMLYNVPSRTGCDLLPETVAQLSSDRRVIGVKEAVADADRMQQLLQLQGDQFSVFSGDDPTAARAMLSGARGVVSVASNVVPAQFAALAAACQAGRRDQATGIDAVLQPLFMLLAAESNPVPLKSILAELGFGSAIPRLPLLRLDPHHHRVLLSQCVAQIRSSERALPQGDSAPSHSTGA
jgi:4-hydroxy-tetrahydrodipicolinate synthase